MARKTLQLTREFQQGAQPWRIRIEARFAQPERIDVAIPMRDRLRESLDGVGFDQIDVSFGEFSGVEPAAFVARLKMTWDALQVVAPGTRMVATIHVGNYPSLRVTYQGENLLYYFLAAKADPHIVPWIHTVMYYDLYEDAGQAYLHDEFDEWAANFRDPWLELDVHMSDWEDDALLMGRVSFVSPYSWESDTRLAHMDELGVDVPLAREALPRLGKGLGL